MRSECEIVATGVGSVGGYATGTGNSPEFHLYYQVTVKSL
jgi:hypothetical protein